MATPTEILAPATDDEIDQKLIDYMRAIPGFPINDWHSGGGMKTLVALERKAMSDLIQSAVPGVIGAGSITYADEGSAMIVAKHLWGLDRVGAVIAQQRMVLTCDGSHGPYTIVAGQFWFTGPTGNRWLNSTGGVLATGGYLVVTIVAEGPGAKYNDPAGTVHTFEPSLPGITASNTAADFTPITSSGFSTGTVAVSRTVIGVAPTPATYILRIDSSGQVGAGAYSYSTNGGKTWTSLGSIAATDINGTHIAFTNGAATPSFVAGDTFSFSTPGSSFTTLGKDREAIKTLAVRCKARWPDLSTPKVESRYSKWAKKASANVTRVAIQEDGGYPGRLILTLAGVAGPVAGGDVTAVQAYMDPRAPIGRIILVQNSTAWEITAGGVVTVAAARKATVQAIAQALWTALLFTTDIGGIVRLSELVKAVMDAGAIDFQGATLNTVAANYTGMVGTNKVAILPVATPLLANQLNWKSV